MPDDEAALRFLADMGVSWRIVEWLRSEGYDATHLRDEGLERSEDRSIFTKAYAENRVLLTFDLDFAEIASHAGSRIVNVVVSAYGTRARPSSSTAFRAFFPSLRKL